MNVKLKLKSNKSEEMLLEIAGELAKKKIKLSDLTALEIELPEDQSFTGAKVRATIFNTLRFALNIPINGTKKIIKPVYSGKPNITKKR